MTRLTRSCLPQPANASRTSRRTSPSWRPDRASTWKEWSAHRRDAMSPRGQGARPRLEKRYLARAIAGAPAETASARAHRPSARPGRSMACPPDAAESPGTQGRGAGERALPPAPARSCGRQTICRRDQGQARTAEPGFRDRGAHGGVRDSKWIGRLLAFLHIGKLIAQARNAAFAKPIRNPPP